MCLAVLLCVACACACEDTSQSEVTCQARPGSWRHEALDAQTYCDADVDYLKIARAPPPTHDSLLLLLLLLVLLLLFTEPVPAQASRLLPTECEWMWATCVVWQDHCGGGQWEVDGVALNNHSWVLFRAALDRCARKRGRKFWMSCSSCGPTDCLLNGTCLGQPSGCGQWIAKGSVSCDLWRTGGGAASVASFLAAVLTEIDLRGVCSRKERLRRNGRGQTSKPGGARSWRTWIVKI
eukprot:COSAG01_NODE_7659_length_3110_cov_2.519429_4_plen_237_part_00